MRVASIKIVARSCGQGRFLVERGRCFGGAARRSAERAVSIRSSGCEGDWRYAVVIRQCKVCRDAGRLRCVVYRRACCERRQRCPSAMTERPLSTWMERSRNFLRTDPATGLAWGLGLSQGAGHKADLVSMYKVGARQTASQLDLQVQGPPLRCQPALRLKGWPRPNRHNRHAKKRSLRQSSRRVQQLNCRGAWKPIRASGQLGASCIANECLLAWTPVMSNIDCHLT